MKGGVGCRVSGFGLAVALWAGVGFADVSTNSSYDELFFSATRYGNTEARREEKKAAREELFRRGPDALREVMNRIHFENIMLQVLAFELVREAVPAEAGTPVLMNYLDSERVEARRMAAYFLGFYPAPEKPERLLNLLADEKTRNAAIRTLGKWKVAAARSEIARLMKEGDKERTRVLCANALRDIGNPDDLPALITALGDPVFTVRNTAARAIAAFGKNAHRPLRNALEGSAGAARRQIVRLLGELQVSWVSRPLRRLEREPDDSLRTDLLRALGEPAPVESELLFFSNK